MNEEWKKKYYFDEKSRVIESPMPNSLPSNVSPFVKVHPTVDKLDAVERSKDKSKKKKDSCVIS